MNQILQNELEFLITYTNRFGEDVTPMFPVRESDMAKFVESFLREGRFIRFKRLA